MNYIAAKIALNSLYKDIATVKTQVENSTGLAWEISQDNVKCRMSYNSAPAVSEIDGSPLVNASVTLFYEPNIIILEGSQIEITAENRNKVFGMAGLTKRYITHCETILELGEFA